MVGHQSVAELGEDVGERGRGEDGEGAADLAGLPLGDRAGRVGGGLRRATGGEGGEDGGEGRDPAPHGTSTLTWVALTVATARTPTSSPSSSAASRDISETSRNGPAWISTWAITVSRRTRVTMPVSRLRADDDRVVPGPGGSRSPVATRAKSAPSTTAGPPPSRCAGS